MLRELIRIANKLDLLGEHDLADEVDALCREAADKFVDLRPEEERARDRENLWDTGDAGVKKELKPRPGESDPRRVLIDEEGVYEEDRSEPTPSERVKKLFPGKSLDIDPDELSEEDLMEGYKSERADERFGPDLDPDEDRLVELLEGMYSKEED
jgi:hypothetical protein